jgi:hypothetical protein
MQQVIQIQQLVLVVHAGGALHQAGAEAGGTIGRVQEVAVGAVAVRVAAML